MTKRFILSIALLPLIYPLAHAQEETALYEYAYLVIRERGLAPEVRVLQLELGDSPDQNQRETTYRAALQKRQSLPAVLQFMSEQGYELQQAFHHDFYNDYPVMILRRRLGVGD